MILFRDKAVYIFHCFHASCRINFMHKYQCMFPSTQTETGKSLRYRNIPASNNESSAKIRLMLEYLPAVRGRVQTTWTNEGEGIAQMTTTLNNSYLVKVSTYLGGIDHNSVHVVCTCPLISRYSMNKYLDSRKYFSMPLGPNTFKNQLDINEK